MIYCFDIDGTLCTKSDGNYKHAKPLYNRIKKVNLLYEKLNTIKLFTARGARTGIDWTEFTKQQLSEWGVLYHELVMGKPHADIFIDDKAFNSEAWNWSVF